MTNLFKFCTVANSRLLTNLFVATPIMAEKKFVPQYSLSLVDQVTDFLTNAVIEGKLKGGERLVENELQRKFGISRGPIRESFRILEKNGLVISTPRKGTHVRIVTPKDIKENFPIRAVLEGLAARLAVSHLRPKDIKALESTLRRMAEAAKKKDVKSVVKNHFKYGNILISACKNDKLIEILGNLRRQALWYLFSYRYIQETYKYYDVGVHQKILDLIKKKDADRLEAFVKKHVMDHFDTLH